MNPEGSNIELGGEHPGIGDLYHASAFTHPQILVFTNREPDKAIPSTWGLIPNWVKDNNQRLQLWNKTLNARGETIFEKPSFRFAAKNKRCLIYLDGFYEHHHYKGKTYPFFIYRKDKEPMPVAGLWSEWTDKETGDLLNTFSIVTTNGNALMARIHNSPKLLEPRMPVIIPDELVDAWLSPVRNEKDLAGIKHLIRPYRDNALTAHTVQKLRGKNSPGNVPGVCDELIYDELAFDLIGLSNH